MNKNTPERSNKNEVESLSESYHTNSILIALLEASKQTSPITSTKEKNDHPLQSPLIGSHRQYSMSFHSARVIDPMVSTTMSPSTAFIGETNHEKSISRNILHNLLRSSFYHQTTWIEDCCELLFKIKRRNTTIQREIYCGCIHFFSGFIILAIIPNVLAKANYNFRDTMVAISLCIGIGNILSGLITNLPFLLAPVSAISIFLSVTIRSNNITPDDASYSVIISGIMLLILFNRKIAIFFSKLIPMPIRVGTSLGIAIVTTLAGTVSINLIQQGKYSLLQIGKLNTCIILSILGIILYISGNYYNYTGTAMFVLSFISFLYWAIANEWPKQVFSIPHIDSIYRNHFHFGFDIILIFELFFLYTIFLNGLIPNLTQLSKIQRSDGSTPRGRWLLLIMGLMTIISGCILSSPILLWPDSSIAIRLGARTGLSTVVSGCLFLCTIFLSPILQSIPSAATSCILICIGILLFRDANKANWISIEDNAVTFIVMFFIPFTYSVLYGIAMGYVIYILIGICTGKAYSRFIEFSLYYLPSNQYLNKEFNRILDNEQKLLQQHNEDNEFIHEEMKENELSIHLSRSWRSNSYRNTNIMNQTNTGSMSQRNALSYHQEDDHDPITSHSVEGTLMQV